MTKDKLNEKVDLYIEAKDAYYNTDSPMLSDSEFDALGKEIETYREKYPSIVKRIDIIGSSTELRPMGHVIPMYSLDNVFSIQELAEWMDKHPKVQYSLEYKYDGASIDIYYKDGKLTTAISRGDGKVGTIVTHNVEHIVHKDIGEGTHNVHGEIYISYKDFDKANIERVKSKEKPYLSPRNAASAAMLRGAPYVKLRFSPYAWFKGEDRVDAETLYDNFGPLIPYKKIGDKDTILKEVVKLYNNPTKKIPVDGLVVKIVDKDVVESLGHNTKYPKFAIALKFPETDRSTILEDVVWQVGHTGNITPVGILKPVTMSDCVVSRVTLNNAKYIIDTDLGYQDKVLIIRSGGVIPKLTGTLQSAVPKLPIVIPRKCPSCNKTVSMEGPILKCVNSKCRDRVIAKMTRFASRDHADIKGTSRKTIEALYDKGINTLPKLVEVDKEMLLSIDGIEEKSADNILASIKKIKGLPMNRFLSSLGIDRLGRTASKAIAEKIEAIEDINSNVLSPLGLITSSTILLGLAANITEISLLEGILKPKPITKDERPTVCFTGKFDTPRKELQKMYTDRGYSITDKVNKDLNLLVVGDKPSSKLEKAKKLNVDITYYKKG